MDDIAVLCSGPSFAEFLADPAVHGLYIGVNRVVAHFPCHWWSFNDARTFGSWSPLCREGRLPAIFTTREAFTEVRGVANDRAHTWLFHDQAVTACPRKPGWVHYSFTSALVLAEHLGAKLITLYGVDQKGAEDWDGAAPNTVNRPESRWSNERYKTLKAIDYLRTRGIGVVRGLEGVPA